MRWPRCAQRRALRRSVLLTLVFLAALSAPVRARADGSDVSASLSVYEVDASCPARTAFVEALEARVGARSSAAFAVTTLAVRVARPGAEPRWVGELETTSAALGTARRRVEDSSCEAVLHALSLVAALSIETSRAALEPFPSRPAPGPGPASTGAARRAPEPAAPSRADELRGPLRSRSAAGVEVGVTLRASADGAVAPRLASGWGGGVTLGWAAPAPFRPSLDVTAMALRGRSVSLANGNAIARFEALLIGATLCPVRTLASSAWSLSPCVTVDAGWLTASGTGPALVRAAERRAPWLSTGGALRAEVTLGDGVRALTEVGVTVPWSRHEFSFVPGAITFRVPPLAGRALGALALTF